MAIILNIKDYCSECCDFEPDVTRPEKGSLCSGGEELVVLQTDTIVRCRYARRCENIRRYLAKQEYKEG